MIDALDFVGLLQLPPRDALVRIVTQANQVFVNSEHLEFGTPVALVGRETEVVVTGRRPADTFTGQLYKGSIVFRFKRIDFAELFANTKLSVQIDLPCKTSDLIEVMAKHFGYVFDSSDYVNELITADNAYEYVLKAAPYSLRWWGQVTVSLLKKVSLDAVTPTQDFGRLITPDTKRHLQLEQHFTDGRFYGTYLKRLQLGEIPRDEILPQLLSRVFDPVGVEPIDWTYSDIPTPANLKGARLSFNGRAVDAGVVPYLFTVSRVAQLQLDESLNTEIRGPLTVNYNSQVVELVPEFPAQGYRFPAELWAGVLDGTDELGYFGALYDGTVLNNLADTAFMDRILGLPEGSVTCSPTPSQVNLYNATVEYLGRNISYPACYNPFLTLIWVVRLDPKYSTYLGGRLMIYYTR